MAKQFLLLYRVGHKVNLGSVNVIFLLICEVKHMNDSIFDSHLQCVFGEASRLSCALKRSNINGQLCE